MTNTNQTYNKYKRQNENIKGLIKGFEAYVSRYIRQVTTSNYLEYAGAVKDLIDDIKKEFDQ